MRWQTGPRGLVQRLRTRHTNLAFAREICEGLLEMIPAVDTEEWHRISSSGCGRGAGSAKSNAMATYRVLILTGVIGAVLQALEKHLDNDDLTVSVCKILHCLVREAGAHQRHVAAEVG